MKKILFFLLMALSVAAFSQGKKISDLTESSTMLPNGVLEIEQGGSSYSISKSDLQKTLRDSLKAAYTLIYELFDLIGNAPPSSSSLLVSYDFSDSIDNTSYKRNFLPSDDFNFIYTDPLSGTAFFDTVSMYVTSPTFDHTSTFTVMADVIIGNDSSGQRFIAGNMSGNDGWELRVNANTGRVLFVTGSGGSIDSLYTDANTFRIDTIFPYKVFRVAVTSNGEMYIDGKSKNVSGNVYPAFATSSQIRIGTNKSVTNTLHGYVDNFKIFSGALSSIEVANEYASNEYFYNPNLDLPPTVYASDVSSNPRIVNIDFSERIYNVVSDSVDDAFTVRINGASVPIDSIDVNPSRLSFYIGDTVEYGNAVTLAYNANYYSGLEDFRYNKMASFTGFPVTNNIAEIDSVSAAEWHYLFNGSNEDYSENDNAWTNNGTSFSTIDKIEGTHSMWKTSALTYITTPTMDNTDTIAFGGWIKNSYSETNNRQIFYVDATTYLELDLLSDRIVFSANSGEAQATGIADMNDGTWHHYWVQHSTSSANTEIYYDGVDVTTDATAATGASFAGQWNIGDEITGWFDDWSCYYDRWLTSTEVASLENNPGSFIYSSSGVTPDPPPINNDTAWEAIATTLMFLDFDNWGAGEYTQARIRTDLIGDSNTELLYEGGTMWRIYPPVLKDYAYDSAGTVKHSNGLFMRQLEGLSNSVQVPGHVYHGLPRNSNADDVWLGFYMGYTGPLWDNLEATTKREWKTNGVWAGIFPESIPPGTGAAVITATVPNRPNAKMKYKVMGKSNEWNRKATRFYTYLDSDPYDRNEEFGTTVPDPDDLTSSFYLFHSAADSQRVHITHHIYLGTPNTPDAFVETFIDGKFAWRAEGFVARDASNIVIDMFNLSYFWGGGEDDFPPNEDAEIWYDDIEVWLYKENYRVKGRKSQPGETIPLRNFNASTGEKK